VRILLIGANSVRMDDGRRWRETSSRAAYAPTTLTTLAALIPPEFDAEVFLIDEAVDEPPEDFYRADLVGISAMTPDAHRAYELSRQARALGAKVVLGGYHPTFMTEEALRHCDAVVRGFAETAWPQLLRDYARGQLRRIYESPWEEAFTAGNWIPRRDLLRPCAYVASNTLETSRGCRNQCSFCIVPPMHRGSFVQREIGRIRREIESMPAGPIGILDANPLEDAAFAEQLMPVMSGRNWYTAVSSKVISDPGWARRASAAGCRGVVAGFETLDQNALGLAGKSFNRANSYDEICRRLHGEGIAILGCFVLGLDGEGPDAADRVIEFVNKSCIDVALYSAYTPFPGTADWRRLQSERRILSTDWRLYDGRHVVFQPDRMSPEDLQHQLHRAWRETYSLPSIFRRVLGSMTMPVAGMAVNLGFRFYRRTFTTARAAVLAGERL